MSVYEEFCKELDNESYDDNTPVSFVDFDFDDFNFDEERYCVGLMYEPLSFD